MKIGKLVQSQISNILRYCEDHPDEIFRLMDKDYSNQSFKLNWPFCLDENRVLRNDRERYWTSHPFSFNRKSILVCSQWYERNRSPFCNYLVSKGIIGKGKLSVLLSDGGDEPRPKSGKSSTTSSGTTKIIKSRYKATTEGDAANSVVRAILSNLGKESFSRQDWDETKEYFLHRCAYYDEKKPNCDETIPTHQDHIVPINKTQLGEHRLGNLVPSCNACNKKKHQGDFRDVFADRVDAISRIEVYMTTRGYVPLGNNAPVKMILDQAYSEVKALVDRYISIIEAALTAGSRSGEVMAATRDE